METTVMPNLVYIAGDGKNTGQELILNMNQVRLFEIHDNEITLVFSEQHRVNITGKAYPELLGFLGVHSVLTDGTPLPEAKPFKRSSDDEGLPEA